MLNELKRVSLFKGRVIGVVKFYSIVDRFKRHIYIARNEAFYF